MEQTEESGYRSADEFLIFARRSNYRFSGWKWHGFPSGEKLSILERGVKWVIGRSADN